MDVRELRAWQAEARYRRALRQLDAIQAQQFVWMDQGERERVMDGLRQTIKDHEQAFVPEESAEAVRQRQLENIRKVKRMLGGAV